MKAQEAGLCNGSDLVSIVADLSAWVGDVTKLQSVSAATGRDTMGKGILLWA